MDKPARPLMQLADAQQLYATEAAELQIGAGLDGRVLLVLKRGEQRLAYPLNREQAINIVLTLGSAFGLHGVH